MARRRETHQLRWLEVVRSPTVARLMAMLVWDAIYLDQLGFGGREGAGDRWLGDEEAQVIGGLGLRRQAVVNPTASGRPTA